MVLDRINEYFGYDFQALCVTNKYLKAKSSSDAGTWNKGLSNVVEEGHLIIAGQSQESLRNWFFNTSETKSHKSWTLISLHSEPQRVHIHSVFTYLENNNYIRIVFADFSSAFNTI